MRDVYLISGALEPVLRKGDSDPLNLGIRALRSCIDSSSLDPVRIDSLHVGNMLSGLLSNQQQLGSLLADYAGLNGIEASCHEAACASGAVAAREAYLRVATGQCDAALACGVEVMTSAPSSVVTRALAGATDWALEGSCGETFISLNAELTRIYCERYGVLPEDFSVFPLNAHRNSLSNPNAALRTSVDLSAYLESRIIHDPLRLYDISPICDGAAAVLLGTVELAREASRLGHAMIRVAGSSAATDTPALSRRTDCLKLRAAEVSSAQALRQAGIRLEALDFFEAHDAYSVMGALSLEAAGFAEPGHGVGFAAEGNIGLQGSIPMSTLGGLKARGHPVGATGVYQLVEALIQLSGGAGQNQVHGASWGMVQNFGGIAATVVSHVLCREG